MGRTLRIITPTGPGQTFDTSYSWVHTNRVAIALAAAHKILTTQDPFLADPNIETLTDIPGGDVIEFAEMFVDFELNAISSHHDKMLAIATLNTKIETLLKDEDGTDPCYEGVGRGHEVIKTPLRAALETYCSTPDHTGSWSIGEVHDICFLLTSLLDCHPQLVEDHVTPVLDFFNDAKRSLGWVLVC